GAAKRDGLSVLFDQRARPCRAPACDRRRVSRRRDGSGSRPATQPVAPPARHKPRRRDQHWNRLSGWWRARQLVDGTDRRGCARRADWARVSDDRRRKQRAPAWLEHGSRIRELREWTRICCFLLASIRENEADHYRIPAWRSRRNI